MSTSAVAPEQVTERSDDRRMRVSGLAPVAGIAIRHEREAGIEFAGAPAWPGSASSEPSVVVRHVVGDVSVEGLPKRFDASPSCAYLERDGEVVVQFRGPTAVVPDQLLLAVRPGYEYELRYAARPASPMYQHAKDRTIFSMALAQRGRGYIAHACGFLLETTAVLCPGLPSAGKSTLARLLGSSGAGVCRLSDDRIALTREASGFRAWGTPWPGDERVIGAGDGPLGAIVLLRHAASTSLTEVSRRLAARRVMETLVLPLWDRTLLPGALEYVDRLIDAIPVLELAYPPTVEAARWFVRELERRGRDG